MASKKILEILIRGDASSALTALEQTQKRAEAVGRRLSQVGQGLTRGLTLPILAAGAALGKVGDTFQQANARIRRETGATGERLAALEADFREAFRQVPESADQVAGALSLIATRTGLVGAPLQSLTRQLVELSKITKTDVSTNVNLATRVFGDWEIATERQARSLDFLFRVSQATGAGVDDLMQKVVQFGAPLRQMGFDFEQAAALIGKFQAEGVNLEVVLSSLRQGLGRMAKEGINDPAEAFRVLIARIQEAGSAGEATRLAIETFGSRAGPDMAAAIREGRFALDDLIAKLGESEDTIIGVAEETRTFGESMRIMGNRLLVALEPLGTALLRTFRSLEPVLDRTIALLARAVEAAAALPRPVQLAAVAFLGLAAALGPVLLLAGNLIKTFAALTSVIAVLKGAAGIAGLAAAVAGLGSVLLPGAAIILGLVALVGLFRQLRRGSREAREEMDAAQLQMQIAGLEARAAAGEHLTLAERQELSALRARLQAAEQQEAAGRIRLAGLEARAAAGEHLALAEAQELAALQAQREGRAATVLAGDLARLTESLEGATEAQRELVRFSLGGRLLGIADEMRTVRGELERFRRDVATISPIGPGALPGPTGAQARAIEELEARLRSLGEQGEEVRQTIEGLFQPRAAPGAPTPRPAGFEGFDDLLKGKQKTDPVAEAVKRLQERLRGAELQAKLLGESFDLSGERASAYGSALQDLARHGEEVDGQLSGLGTSLSEISRLHQAARREAEIGRIVAELEGQNRELQMTAEGLLRARLEALEASEAELEYALSLQRTNEQLERRLAAQAEVSRALQGHAEGALRAASELHFLRRALDEGLQGEEAIAVATAEANRALRLQELALQGATPMALAFASAWMGVEVAATRAAEALKKQEQLRLARIAAELQQLAAAAQRMAERVEEAFFSLVDGSKRVVDAIRDMVGGILRELARLVIRRTITEPLANLISGALGGLKFEHGGRPPVGQAALVGEAGRELFVADRPGVILPHDVTEAILSGRRVPDSLARKAESLGVRLAPPEAFLPGAERAGAAPARSSTELPSFQEGGRAPVGGAALLGERGPDLFVVPRAGVILPNDVTEAVLSGSRVPERIRRKAEALGVRLAPPETFLPALAGGFGPAGSGPAGLTRALARTGGAAAVATEAPGGRLASVFRAAAGIGARPFAFGGRVGPGMPVLAGERGRELFLAEPAGGAGDGGRTEVRREVVIHHTTQINIDTIDRRGVAAFFEENRGLLRRMQEQNIRESFSHLLESNR